MNTMQNFGENPNKNTKKISTKTEVVVQDGIDKVSGIIGDLNGVSKTDLIYACSPQKKVKNTKTELMYACSKK